MGPFWIKWLLPLFVQLINPTKGSPSVLPVLNYPANPSYVQAHGHFLPISSSPTTYTTQTLGLPVLTSQSSFFVKSLPSLVNTATPLVPLPSAPATPLVPLPTASTPTLLPLPSTPLPLPPNRSVPVPTLLIYSDGSVVPLSDTHYKFPPVVEGFINRVQNYFSNYVQIDPNSVPFPTKSPKLVTTANNSSTAAITTTTTTTTTAKTFGPAINLRLVAAPNNHQNQPNVGFARTSTVPTSSGRTAKLVEVFRPNGQLSGSLVQSTEDNQTPLAIATATATVNFDGSDPNRPNPEFGSNPPLPAPVPSRPEQPPHRPEQPTYQPPHRPEQPTYQPPHRPEQPTYQPPHRPEQPTYQPPHRPEQPTYQPPLRPEQPTYQPPHRPEQLPNGPSQPPHRPRPGKPITGPRPDQGYRYDRPAFRPLEYGDVPPKPEAYRFKGSF